MAKCFRDVVSAERHGIRTVAVTSFSWPVTVRHRLVTFVWPIKYERKSARGFQKQLLLN